MRKVPELRFDGFDGEWEEKKLEDSFNVTMGQSPNSKNYTVDSDSLPLIGGNADIKQGKINPSIFTTQITKKSYPGNIIMTVRAPVGDLAMNSSQVVIGRGVCSIDGNNYLYYNLEKKKYENYWRRFISGSTFESINSSDVKGVLISIPENYEQEKIGDLFKNIDALIEKQEDKVSKMEDFKKSMLQNMFPKKGNLVPEFRFDGFDGDWKSIILSDVSNRITRKNIKNQSKLPLTISSELGLVNQLDYYNNRVASKDISNYYLIMNGEFAYNKSTSLTAPYGAIKRLDYYENGALSTLYIVFEIVNNDLDFMKYYFETSLWHKEIYKVSQEGARNHGLLNIATDDFFSMKLKIPNLEEQEKIGNFFKNLDGQIEAEEKLLESYKMIKKSLLQKMFV